MLPFLGVVVQLGGAVMLIGLFLTLRRLVMRRAYFGAWSTAWAALALAIAALVVRYVVAPIVAGTPLGDDHPVVLVLYFTYQLGKTLGLLFFVRGTLLYVSGGTVGSRTTRRMWVGSAAFALASTLLSSHGLNEMVVWQSAIAVPALGYCASALLWLPRSRRTIGSMTVGMCFTLLAALWLADAGAFTLIIHHAPGPLSGLARGLVSYNAYLDLTFNVLLGYSMILALMEDARREVDAAQAELRVTHDQLRRAALYDSLTDSLNRRAYAEGVGLEMVRATFGTVLLADLDNLKFVNDRYGNAAGDELLRRCADIVRATLRPYDKLYRWGGDEFLLIVPSAHASDVQRRLQDALDNAEAIEAGMPPEPVRLQVSLGAADYTSSEELSHAIERADRAMYHEKMRRKSDVRSMTPTGFTPPAAALPVR